MTTTLSHRSAQATGSRGRRPAAVALAASAGSIVAITLAGLLDPGYSAASEAISALASTESQSAPIMTIGFALMAVTAVSGGVAVWRALGVKIAAAAGILLTLAGVLTLAEAFFRQSCSSLQQVCLQRESAGTVSSDHMLHNLIALPLFGFLVIAGFLLVGAVGRSPARRRYRGRVLTGAICTLILFVWFGSGAYSDLGGLVQRALVLSAYGLPVIIGWAAARTRIAG